MLRTWYEDADHGMRCIKLIADRSFHKKSTALERLLWVGRKHWIAGIFFPVHKVARGGDIGAPSTPLFLVACMVVRVVTSLVPNHLIKRHSICIILLGTAAKHRLILQVGPDLKISRCCQPYRCVFSLIVEMP